MYPVLARILSLPSSLLLLVLLCSNGVQAANTLTLRPTISTPSKISFRITVNNIETGQPVPNAYVWLRPEAEANSGGHDHDDAARPAGTFDKYEGSTGSDGQGLSVTYTAPQVSGTVQVRVDCTSPSGPCNSGNLPINVEVPGLVPLPAGLNYNLVGSFGLPGVTSQHSGNHFGTSSFTAKLVYLADLYYLKFNSKLDYNDISLPLGGLFDIGNNWRPSHHEHRVGISGDIRLVPAGRRKDLRDMVKAARITGATIEHSTHWHVREFGSSN